MRSRCVSRLRQTVLAFLVSKSLLRSHCSPVRGAVAGANHLIRGCEKMVPAARAAPLRLAMWLSAKHRRLCTVSDQVR